MERRLNTSLYTLPIFLKEASSLIKELIKYSPEDLEGLMKVNSNLSEQSFMRHITWEKEHDLSNGKQALLAYDGAVFKGLNAGDLNQQQLSFANENLIILSGLYGALRPLDLVQPYRLEMGTKLKGYKNGTHKVITIYTKRARGLIESKNLQFLVRPLRSLHKLEVFVYLRL